MLPNMSQALRRFEMAVTYHAVVQTIVNYKPVNTETDSAEEAVVQPAQKDKLNPDVVDWSLDYKTMHSRFTSKLNDKVTVDGIKYKIIEAGDFSAYGFAESLLEEIK